MSWILPENYMEKAIDFKENNYMKEKIKTKMVKLDGDTIYYTEIDEKYFRLVAIRMTDKEVEDILELGYFVSKYIGQQFTYKGRDYIVTSKGRIRLTYQELIGTNSNDESRYLDDKECAIIEELLDSLNAMAPNAVLSR